MAEEAFELNFNEEPRFEDTHDKITLWLEASYKAKFDQLQKHSKKEFGKWLQRLVCQEIEKHFGQK